MPTYDIADIVGTNLRLAKTGIAHVGSPESSEIVYYYAGSYFPVYSYLSRTNGVWFMTDYLKSPDGRSRYIKLENTLFVPPGSTPTVEEKKQAAADDEKPWYEKLGEGATDTIETLGIAAVVAWLGFKLFDSYTHGKKS